MDKPVFSVSITDNYYGDTTPITLQGGGLENNIKLAAELGFDGVELQLHTPANYVWDHIGEMLDKYGLVITALGTGLEYGINELSLTAKDQSVRKETQKRFFEYIKIAAQFNAVVFLGLCRGISPTFLQKKKSLDLFYEEIVPLCDYANNLGVVLVLEPIVFYLTNLLNTTRESIEFLKRPGLENVQLLLDTHHMFIEDPELIEAFKISKDIVGHVHISDSNRQYPGSGKIDFNEVGKALNEINYTRAVSLETLPVPDCRQAAAFGIEWMNRVWP